MSRRTIVALAASVIIGIGFILTISTEASAYYRVVVVSTVEVAIAEAFTGVAITGAYAREWR